MIVKPRQIIKYKGKIYTAGSEVPDEALVDSAEFNTPIEPSITEEDLRELDEALELNDESSEEPATSLDIEEDDDAEEEIPTGKNKRKKRRS